MSYSQLIVFRNGLAEGDAEFRNSHGVCPMVWTALCTKYRTLIYPDDPLTRATYRDIFTEWGDLWAAAKERLTLRAWEHLALQFTYDNALVKRRDFTALADALERFEDAHNLPGRVCHLTAIAARLRELMLEDDVDAVGLYGTSVGENPWWEHDPAPDESTPYDIRSGTKHWWIEHA